MAHGNQKLPWSSDYFFWVGVSVTKNYTNVNTLRLRQKGHHFPGDNFKCTFVNENVWISIKISLKFVPKGPINSLPALVQIMAWCRSGSKPISSTNDGLVSWCINASLNELTFGQVNYLPVFSTGKVVRLLDKIRILFQYKDATGRQYFILKCP